MKDFNDKIGLLAQKWLEADAILIGAGAGLTTSAGLLYAGDAFQKNFGDYIERFGFTDLYSSGFFPFATPGMRWAYWARHVNFTRFEPPALPLYKILHELATGRNYFVITTNVDGQFYKSGFSPEKIFAVQGDYAEMQCARACHPRVYSNRDAVRAILANSHDFTVDEQYVPVCPVCGGEMDMHLRKDNHFVEDENWQRMAAAYEEFLGQFGSRKILLLEIGVGFNTPGIIRYPFERLASVNRRAFLARVNQNEPQQGALLGSNFIAFAQDAAFVLNALQDHLKQKS